jgi:atypical dual specificity phosphatase
MPAMPRNFTFVIEGVLAGMERPGTSASLREDLEFLKGQGIGAIVSLTCTPLDEKLVRELGFRCLHLPVVDLTPPDVGQVEAFLAFQRSCEAERVAVVVHCGAGQGRTGTVLACALVQRGVGAEEAIARVRRLRPCSIETPEQEAFVRAFEAHVKRGP